MVVEKNCSDFNEALSLIASSYQILLAFNLYKRKKKAQNVRIKIIPSDHVRFLLNVFSADLHNRGKLCFALIVITIKILFVIHYNLR